MHCTSHSVQAYPGSAASVTKKTEEKEKLSLTTTHIHLLLYADYGRIIPMLFLCEIILLHAKFDAGLSYDD